MISLNIRCGKAHTGDVDKDKDQVYDPAHSLILSNITFTAKGSHKDKSNIFDTTLKYLIFLSVVEQNFGCFAL